MPDAGTQSVVSQFHADMESMGWKVCAIEVARLFVLSEVPAGGTRDHPVPPSMSAVGVGGGGDSDDDNDDDEEDEDIDVDEDEEDEEDEEDVDDGGDPAAGGLVKAKQQLPNNDGPVEGRVGRPYHGGGNGCNRVDVELRQLCLPSTNDRGHVAPRSVPAILEGTSGAVPPMVTGIDPGRQVHPKLGDTGVHRGRVDAGASPAHAGRSGSLRSVNVGTHVSVSPGIGQSPSDE